MNESSPDYVGRIDWHDLTVPNADEVRDFYQGVVGWTTTNVDMGGYSDYCMNTPGEGTTVTGVCHARGTNEGLPAQWLMYVNVADIEASLKKCDELGGERITEVKSSPQGSFCVIKDPAGAVLALYQPAAV